MLHTPHGRHPCSSAPLRAPVCAPHMWSRSSWTGPFASVPFPRVSMRSVFSFLLPESVAVAEPWPSCPLEASVSTPIHLKASCAQFTCSQPSSRILRLLGSLHAHHPPLFGLSASGVGAGRHGFSPNGCLSFACNLSTHSPAFTVSVSVFLSLVTSPSPFCSAPPVCPSCSGKLMVVRAERMSEHWSPTDLCSICARPLRDAPRVGV